MFVEVGKQSSCKAAATTARARRITYVMFRDLYIYRERERAIVTDTSDISQNDIGICRGFYCIFLEQPSNVIGYSTPELRADQALPPNPQPNDCGLISHSPNTIMAELVAYDFL